MRIIRLFRFLGGRGFVEARLGKPFYRIIFCALPVGKHSVVILRAEPRKTFECVREEFPLCASKIHETQKTQKPHVLGFIGKEFPARHFNAAVVDVPDLADFTLAGVKIGIVVDVRAHRGIARNGFCDNVKKLGNGTSPCAMAWSGVRTENKNIVIALVRHIYWMAKGSPCSEKNKTRRFCPAVTIVTRRYFFISRRRATFFFWSRAALYCCVAWGDGTWIV